MIPLKYSMKSTPLLLIIFLVLISQVAHSQSLRYEGKEWFDLAQDPPEAQVGGTWDSEDWGEIVLEQADTTGREILGTCNEDEWAIYGVVSGKTVLLAFFDIPKSFPEGVAERRDFLRLFKDPTIIYSAFLSLQDSGALVGFWRRGITTESGGTKFWKNFSTLGMTNLRKDQHPMTLTRQEP